MGVEAESKLEGAGMTPAAPLASVGEEAEAVVPQQGDEAFAVLQDRDWAFPEGNLAVGNLDTHLAWGSLVDSQ